MKKTLFCISFCIISFGVFSQSHFKEGFIVTNNLDTIYGFINQKKTKNNSVKCIFKLKDQPVQEYSADQITSYGIEREKLYVSQELEKDGEKTFLFFECLVLGKVDLFYLKHDNFTGYYLRSNAMELKRLTNPTKQYKDQNGTIIERPSYEYRKQLRQYLSDCMLIYDDINYANLSHKSLKKLLLRYHELIAEEGKNSLTFHNTQKAITMQLGLTGGFNLYSLKLDSYYWDDIKLSSQLGYNLGILMNIKWAKLNENFNFVIAFNIENQSFTGSKFETGIYGWDTDTKVDFSNILLNSKVIVKYDYPIGKITPFIKAGINLNTELHSESSVIEQRLIDGTISGETTYDYYPIPPSFIGYNVGLGCTYKLSNNKSLLFDINYSLSYYSFLDSDSGYFDNEINGQLSNLSFTIGIIF